MSIQFSIIIPAYNEENYLPRLLHSIEIARANYLQNEVEIIVADNCSTDKTVEVAESSGCKVITVEKRRIACARNGGASIARGEILCFIDADSQIHPQTFAKIAQTLADKRIIGGATGLYLERKSLPILLAYYCLMFFASLTKIDAGVVFCHREDFQAIGGYDENLPFAEDVAFLFALKRRGRQKGQKITRLTSVKALGSTRKFDDFGDWHYLLLPFRFAIGFFTSRDKMREFSDYWYKPNR